MDSNILKTHLSWVGKLELSVLPAVTGLLIFWRFSEFILAYKLSI